MNNMSCWMVGIGALLLTLVALLEVTHPDIFPVKHNAACVREIQWQDAMKAVKRDVNKVCPAV